MSDTGYAKGQCQNCGGHLEFPAAGTGQTIDCPHCGSQTRLIPHPSADAATPGNFPAGTKGKFPVRWGLIILILILVAAGGALYWFKTTGRNLPVTTQAAPPTMARPEMPKQPSPAPETNDLFATGPALLEKTEGTSLIYAVGTVRNNSDRQRFGVKIELDLLDGQDNKIGEAGDYIAILEPHKDWQFRALLTQPRAVKATVAKIEEQK